MPGWLVTTARPSYSGWSFCAFWTGKALGGAGVGVPVAPAVTQAAVGAGHWAAGHRQRALAAWASAAGFGLVAWGLGAEAPTRAAAQKNIEQQKDLLRKRGLQVPATAARTETSMARRRLRNALDTLGLVLDGPRRAVGPAPPAAADGARDRREAPFAVFYGLRVPRAVQRRRPRIAAGSALVVAGAVARLRAASAEPLR